MDKRSSPWRIMAHRYKQKSHSDRGPADDRGTSRVDDSGSALAVSSHTSALSDVRFYWLFFQVKMNTH
jgi:hypothetical protein